MWDKVGCPVCVRVWGKVGCPVCVRVWGKAGCLVCVRVWGKAGCLVCVWGYPHCITAPTPCSGELCLRASRSSVGLLPPLPPKILIKTSNTRSLGVARSFFEFVSAREGFRKDGIGDAEFHTVVVCILAQAEWPASEEPALPGGASERGHGSGTMTSTVFWLGFSPARLCQPPCSLSCFWYIFGLIVRHWDRDRDSARKCEPPPPVRRMPPFLAPSSFVWLCVCCGVLCCWG